MSDEAIENLHTIVDTSNYAPGYYALITKTGIYAHNEEKGITEHRYSSFNLSPYNIQVINAKYLYFQNLDGVCLLNLRTIVFQSQGQEILLHKTFNSTNQIQYDPRFDRLLFFQDFETILIIPLPHKNTIVPFGFNRLTGKFQPGDEIDACMVTAAPHDDVLSLMSQQMYKRLVAITKNKSVITWEYPTG
jgi:hypothetical protein